jgi:hypothetical protein
MLAEKPDAWTWYDLRKNVAGEGYGEDDTARPGQPPQGTRLLFCNRPNLDELQPSRQRKIWMKIKIRKRITRKIKRKSKIVHGDATAPTNGSYSYSCSFS